MAVSTSRTEVPGSYRFIGLTTVFLTSCFALLYMLTNGVNVPFCDDFSFVPLIKAVPTGTINTCSVVGPIRRPSYSYSESHIPHFESDDWMESASYDGAILEHYHGGRFVLVPPLCGRF
jgi:hypothetical protein